MSENKKSILYLCAGVANPGINSVISSASKVFLKDNHSVMGIHEGFRELFCEEPKLKKSDYKTQRVIKY
jgi:6-phosphofructokinase 1